MMWNTATMEMTGSPPTTTGSLAILLREYKNQKKHERYQDAEEHGGGNDLHRAQLRTRNVDFGIIHGKFLSPGAGAWLQYAQPIPTDQECQHEPTCFVSRPRHFQVPSLGVLVPWASGSRRPASARKLPSWSRAIAALCRGTSTASSAARKATCSFRPIASRPALGMMYGGARGQTASEMAKVMHFSQSPDVLHRSAGSLIGMINGKNGIRSYQLFTANRLWGQQGYGFDPNFIKLLQNDYGGGLQEVDFAKAPEQSRQTINGWVEEQTNQKIKELLAPGKVLPTTRLVLTNAIYFKAAWAQRFSVSSKAPKLGEFKLFAKSVANVPMMSGMFLKGIKTGEAEGVQVVRCSEVKNELSMFILLPNEIDGLPALEKKLAEQPALLGNLLSRAEPGRAKLTMPKFGG